MRKLLPIILAILGVVLFAVGIARTVGGVTGTVNSVGSSWVAGGSTTQTLTAGGYTVYERALAPTLSSGDVTVTGPNGSVPVGNTVSSTVTLGSVTWVGVADFTAAVDGEYTIDVSGAGQEVVIGPSLAKTLGNAFLWIGLAMLGVFLAVAGLVWLVVVLVIGRREPVGVAPGAAGANGVGFASGSGVVSGGPPVAPAGSQMGGWYPDPEDPGQWRWWDGRQWTDQRAPRA